MLLLYIAAPLAMFWAVQWERIPIFIALLPAFFIAFILLLGDRNFPPHTRAADRLFWRAVGRHPAWCLPIFGGAATLW